MTVSIALAGVVLLVALGLLFFWRRARVPVATHSSFSGGFSGGSSGSSGNHQPEPSADAPSQDLLWTFSSRLRGFNITAKRLGGAAVLVCDGDVRAGDGDVAMADAVKRLTEEGYRNAAVNLAGVQSIDSSGLGELVRTYTHFQRLGGKLVLVGVNRRVGDLLTMMRLSDVITVVASEAEAAEMFPR